MDWVAIDVNIAGDAVTHRLADAFRLRIAEAAGLLALAFAGMAQHAQDGNLTTVTDSQIEEWARWHGRRGAFATLFRAQLCDKAGTVRAWEKYNGAAIREAKAGRERMREHRRKKRAERAAKEQAEREAHGTPDGTAYPTPHGTPDGTPNGTRDVRHNLTRPDLTRPDQQSVSSVASATPPASSAGSGESPPTPSSPRPPAPVAAAPPAPVEGGGWVAHLGDRWRARVGPVNYGRLGKALKDAVAQHGEQAVIRAMDGYVDDRLEREQEVKFAWFVEQVTVWVERTAEHVVVGEDGALNERGVRLLGGGTR